MRQRHEVVRPKGYYWRYERERRVESKRIHARIKTLLTLLGYIYEPRSDRETHDLIPGMPRRQGVPRLFVPRARLE